MQGAELQSYIHRPAPRTPPSTRRSEMPTAHDTVAGSTASPSGCNEMDGNAPCPVRKMYFPRAALLTRRSSARPHPPSKSAPPGGTRGRSPAGHSQPSRCRGSHSCGEEKRDQLALSREREAAVWKIFTLTSLIKPTEPVTSYNILCHRTALLRPAQGLFVVTLNMA